MQGDHLGINGRPVVGNPVGHESPLRLASGGAIEPAALCAIEALAAELDAIYLQALDRMASQTREAMLIDRTLRQLLDQHETDESILKWDLERAISPRLAFRSLALRLIKEAGTVNSRPVEINPLDYDDLLSWSDAPMRVYGQPTQDFLNSIDYGRTKSISDFWGRLRTRVAPGHDPQEAMIAATSDLMTAFSVQMPNQFIVPFNTLKRDLHVLSFPLAHEEGDLEWVLSQDDLDAISRINHAIATLCQLGGEPVFGTLIIEMNMAFHQRLRANFKRYQPGETFVAGGLISIRMHRSNIDFRCSDWIFNRIRTAFAPIKGLYFVPVSSM